jgi:hypothetical protein
MSGIRVTLSAVPTANRAGILYHASQKTRATYVPAPGLADTVSGFSRQGDEKKRA